MKKLFLLVFLSFIFIFQNISAAKIAEEGVYVFDKERKHLLEIQKNPDLIVDHVSKDGYEVYGRKGFTKNWNKIEFKFLADQQNKFEGSGYPSFEMIEAELKSLKRKYSHISQLQSIGKSVQGRNLLVMKISSQPQNDLIQPEVKFIANMHGDEITGREVMMRLIRDLLESYENGDELITNLIDQTEIFIMPSMNPDGAELRQRANAEWVDLNRDFPDFSTDDRVSSIEWRAPETRAVMRWQTQRQFALSANFHGGAEVVNYMWDTIFDEHPLLNLLKSISLDYSSRVSYLKNSSSFNDGITNGYNWYEVNGGMQDWSYFWHNDLQFTIELSNLKWPSYSEMDLFYQNNREALLNFLKTVHQGAGFYFEKSNLGGIVRIQEFSNGRFESVGTYSFKNSEFYKVLSPAKYRFEVVLNSGLTQYFDTEVEAPIRLSKPKYKLLNP